jgi:hypothetical protein
MIKEVWKWSIDHMDGRAWLYFIFAICGCLPTNHRTYQRIDPEKMVCNLCQSVEIEDVQHVFCCPALTRVNNNLRKAMYEVFKKWELPYYNIGELAETNIKKLWFNVLRDSFVEKHTNNIPFKLSETRLHQLIDDYWKANKQNRHKTLCDLKKKIITTLKKYNCKCSGRHSCQLRNCWSTPPVLTRLLQRHLSLEVEGMADY